MNARPTLVALLLATATASLVPDMKPLVVFFLCVAAGLFASGCSSGFASKLNQMPDGQFATATLVETGKFTHTEITMDGVKKDNGTLTARTLTIVHNNPWVLKFEFKATDYTAQLSPAAKKKLLPPLTPHNSEPIPPLAFNATVTGAGYEAKPTVTITGGGTATPPAAK